ncbi:MAG: cytochrome c1 [Gammaproteobacteria bacterium]
MISGVQGLHAETRTTKPPLRHMKVNLNDTAALRNGAAYVMHRCVACHSLQGARFTAMAGPLDLTDRQVQRYLNTTGRRVDTTIVSSMPDDTARTFLSKKPPDLTVIAKRRTVDWLYTYLTSFYLDPSRPTGSDNVVYHNVAMPDVFADLQGLQEPIMQMGWRAGKHEMIAVGVKLKKPGVMPLDRFDRTARDMVSFLYYIAHPHQQVRHSLGPWILGLLALLLVLSYPLYRLYWSRIRPLEGGRWWHYWKE